MGSAANRPSPTDIVSRQVNTIIDISGRNRVEALIVGQKEAFELALAGASLRDVMGVLAKTAAAQSDDSRTAIFFTDPIGARLRFAASCGMPESYTSAVDNFEIGPHQPSCGTAAYTGETLIVLDVERDPLWQPYLSLVLDHDIRSCWSLPVRNAAGKVLGIFAVYHRSHRSPTAPEMDALGYLTNAAAVLLEKQREVEERRVRAAQFETLLNQAPLGVYLLDASLCIQQTNPAAATMLGVPNLLGRDFDELLHALYAKETADEITGLLRRTLETGARYAASEFPVFRIGGTVKEYYEWRIDRIPLIDGRFGLVCYFRDVSAEVLAREQMARSVTERLQAAEALRESEARFRVLIESVPQLVWACDSAGLRDYLSRQWLEYTGSGDKEQLGYGWLESVHPDDREPVLAAWSSAVARGGFYDVELRLRRYDGVYRWFKGRAVPHRDKAGKIINWFGTSTDIDDQKRVENELRVANHDLEQFAYSASHDLQEPLRSVSLYSQLLLKRYAGRIDSEADQFLTFIKESSERMGLLVSDLLTYTQVTRSDDQTNAWVESEKVLLEVLESLQQSVRESDAQVTHELLPAVPVRSVHLHQLLQNLIGNAIKYRKDSEPPTVHIAAVRENDWWRFSVSDNGIGIDPTFSVRIFGLFQRLHAKRGKYQGTGVGLAICQKIVACYGGKIWVESQGGNGSTFYFTLPAGTGT